MNLEFDCGVIAPNVGELGLALKHHLKVCDNEDCRADVEATIKKFS